MPTTFGLGKLLSVTEEGEPKRRQGRRKKKVPKITQDYLQRAALFHLQRYASSTENLRRILMRKVERAARAHGSSVEEGRAWVDALMTRYQEAGLLDDAAYASGRARRLSRNGRSLRAIEADLRSKGLAAPLVHQTLEALREEAPNAELQAAIRYARKRRLGPWRPEEDRAENRRRDYAALGRRGFSFDIAERIIRANSPESLEEQL